MDKKDDESLTILDLINTKNELGELLSYNEIIGAIKKLEEAKIVALRREEEERKKREREEKERAAREAAQKQKDHIRNVTSMDLPMDWENVFDSDVRTQGINVSIPDGLVLSLTNLGKVDIEYISSISGADYKTVIGTLKGSIYQNPDTWEECFYKGWETAEEYLSGNLMRKWSAARKANREYNGYFRDNLDAISKVMPDAVESKDIYITLGSPWVPTDIIDSFINHVLRPHRAYSGTLHDELTGTWELPAKAAYSPGVRSKSTFGTPKMPAIDIIEKTLNMKTVAVTEKIKAAGTKSGEKRVINEAETVAAVAKQDKLIKEFQAWVWADEARKQRLEEIFENKYSCIRRRIFDGSFLNFPTMSSAISLYPYQKDAVARIIFTPNTLLAHDVGAGKTYVMVAAGMELIRMGLSKKNLFVVPNNLVGQWKDIFRLMYPQANVLCVEPKLFKPALRQKMLQRMRDESFDGIIIAASSFEQIPLSRTYYIQKLKTERAEIDEMLKKRSSATGHLKRRREKINDELASLAIAVDNGKKEIYFDELGVTRLFVDEAHNYKNVPLNTKTTNVMGISNANSQKCKDMMDKVRTVQKQNGGKGVVMATGTPITNSVTDAFVMQQYLQSGELAMLDLQSFDSWIGMFAERVTDFEIDVDTSGYRLATRFARFHNLPELTSLLSSIADFHMLDLSAGIPEHDTKNALVSKTKEFDDYLKLISQRAEDVRRGVVSLKDDNMLTITTDGRKAALDYRLVEPTAAFTYCSKVARCADNVADLYFATSANKSTQLVFCDTSTPKAGFNMYDELKRLLVKQGVPPEEIAYIHGMDTEAQRERLFSAVREGRVRVLIGSTFKLGLGVNIQDRLIALHHLDVPWRPADMTQREGRILRQGNRNPHVVIYRYITEGSFDAYSWQLLETKASFIRDLLSGSIETRSGSDVDDTVLSYAEVKALAVGNPLVKERVETANELTRYTTLQRKLIETKMRLNKELREIPAKKQHQAELISRCEADIKYYAEYKEALPEISDPILKKEQNAKRREIAVQIHKAAIHNVFETRETVFCEYQGFEVILPANMRIEKPYVILKHEGRYIVELGDSEIGCMARLDNCLEGLNSHLTKLEETFGKMRVNEAEIRAELAKKESYVDIIKQYKEKLELIDKKLGVNKK